MNLKTKHNQIKFSDITGEDWPREVREFPPIRPSGSHVVLYTVSTVSREKPPAPYKREEDKWDDYHVRMPHSDRNLYDKESIWRYKTESRWAVIKKSLEKRIGDSKSLIGAILKYNGKFKDVWKFAALELYLNTHLNKAERGDFFEHILPGIIKLALRLPDLIQAPIPLLKQNQCRSLSLSQEQIASLLANAFLCTFPQRNTAVPNSAAARLPKINFASLYESTEDSVHQKLRCICNYFKRVTSKMPTGVVTFSRRSLKPWDELPEWETSEDLINIVPVLVDSTRNIEDAYGLIQVDFANKFLGGGVLGSGMVQEEIRFLMCPELMASMVFTEALGPQEAVMIIGCERYNNYKGYGHDSFRWTGDHRDNTPVDSSGRRLCAVLAIDAEPYWDPYTQFQKERIERELTKAWIGFSFFRGNSKQLLYPGVATGNWGCGAYNGDPQLKCLIQIMAAAAAKRPLAYYTFGNRLFKQEVENAYYCFSKLDVTVGELFRCIMEYDHEEDLTSYLVKNFKNKLAQYRSADKTYSTIPENKKTRVRENNFSLIDFDSQSSGTSRKDDNCSGNVAIEAFHHGDQTGDNHNRSETLYQRDQTNNHYSRSQIHQENQTKDFQNISETHHRGDHTRDYRSRSQTRYQGGDQTNDHYSRSQIHQGDQTKDFQNISETHHQGDHTRDYRSRSQTRYQGGDQTSEHHNRSQINNQGDHITDHHNGYPTNSHHVHVQPQNMPCSSKNFNNDADHTPSNQAPKNYGQYSQKVSEKSGRRDHSKKKWSNRNQTSLSQSQSKSNHNTQWKPDNQPQERRGIGCLTQSFTQMINPGLSYSEAVKGAVQRYRKRDDSSDIYEAIGNTNAFMMRTEADGRAGEDKASDGNVIAMAVMTLKVGI